MFVIHSRLNGLLEPCFGIALKNMLIMKSMDIVLYEPDIPWNTGNIGRTCVATGATLHLVGRLGFSTDAKEIRRSGLDYWDKVKLTRHVDWDAFQASIPPYAPLFLFSRWAKNDLWDANFQSDRYLVFLFATTAIPEHTPRRYIHRLFRIPREKS